MSYLRQTFLYFSSSLKIGSTRNPQIVLQPLTGIFIKRAPISDVIRKIFIFELPVKWNFSECDSIRALDTFQNCRCRNNFLHPIKATLTFHHIYAQSRLRYVASGRSACSGNSNAADSIPFEPIVQIAIGLRCAIVCRAIFSFKGERKKGGGW